MLEHWIKGLQSCASLQPMQENVFIVCDAAQQAAFQTWAANSPQACQAGFSGGKQILTATLGSAAAPNQIAALSAFAATGSQSDMLIVVDGASLCEPGFSMHRFVQHSLARNTDSVGFSSAAYAQGSQQVHLHLEGSGVNPRVTGIAPMRAAQATADDISNSFCMAPVVAITGTSLPKLQQSGAQTLSGALQLLLPSLNVYGLPVQCSFDLSTFDGYLYADAFFGFSQQRRLSSELSGQHKAFLAQVSPAHVSGLSMTVFEARLSALHQSMCQ